MDISKLGYLKLLNRAINGNFDFWQRGISFNHTAVAGTSYAADRFFVATGGAAAKNLTVTQVTDVPTLAQSGFKSTYAWRTVLNSLGAFGVSDAIFAFNQYLEGYFIDDLIGKTITVKFWVKSSKAGVHSIAFRAAGFTQSYVTTFTVASAGVWQKVKVSVKLNDTIAFLITNGIGLGVSIPMEAGANFTTSVLNTWVAGNVVRASSQVAFVATDSIQVAQFMLHEGNSELQFERTGRGVGEELQLCQRYYEKSYNVDVNPGTINAYMGFSCGQGNSGANYLGTGTQFKVEKRINSWLGKCYDLVTGAIDSVNVSLAGSSTGGGPHTVTYTGTHGFGAIVSNSGTPFTANNLYTFHWTADAEL